MTEKPRRPRSRRRRVLLIVAASLVAVLVIAVGGFLVWANQVMPAEEAPLAAVAADTGIATSESDSAIIMTPTGEADGTGLLFIPGAKVEPAAYEAVLAPIVDAGTIVVITKPILNLAFFDQRSLETFTGQAEGVQEWYVGGHSLGGVRACQYAESGPSEGDAQGVTGLVLFGSYCANDLSETTLSVLSVGGSEDGLSTPDKIAGARAELPASADLVEIEGANHASFGAYGAQPGDGEATIPQDEARAEIAAAVLEFLRAGPEG